MALIWVYLIIARPSYCASSLRSEGHSVKNSSKKTKGIFYFTDTCIFVVGSIVRHTKVSWKWVPTSRSKVFSKYIFWMGASSLAILMCSLVYKAKILRQQFFFLRLCVMLSIFLACKEKKVYMQKFQLKFFCITFDFWWW